MREPASAAAVRSRNRSGLSHPVTSATRPPNRDEQAPTSPRGCVSLWFNGHVRRRSIMNASTFSERPVNLPQPENTSLARQNFNGDSVDLDRSDRCHEEIRAFASEAVATRPLELSPQIGGFHCHGSPPSTSRCGTGLPPTSGSRTTGRACHTRATSEAASGSVKSSPRSRAAAA